MVIGGEGEKSVIIWRRMSDWTKASLDLNVCSVGREPRRTFVECDITEGSIWKLEGFKWTYILQSATIFCKQGGCPS